MREMHQPGLNKGQELREGQASGLCAPKADSQVFWRLPKQLEQFPFFDAPPQVDLLKDQLPRETSALLTSQ